MREQTSARALLTGDSATQQETPRGKQWLSAKEAAEYTGLGFSTMAKLRLTGDGPAFSKVGAKVLYHRDNLDNWLHGRSRASTSQAA
jgi:hypothetical protein